MSEPNGKLDCRALGDSDVIRGDLREQLRDATVAAIKKHNNGIYVDCVKVADDTFPLVEAALTSAKGAVREALLEHRFSIGSVTVGCSCGWYVDSTSADSVELYKQHIRSLPDPSVQAYGERIPQVTVSHGAPAMASPPSWNKPKWAECAATFTPVDARDSTIETLQAQLTERDEKIGWLQTGFDATHANYLDAMNQRDALAETIRNLKAALRKDQTKLGYTPTA